LHLLGILHLDRRRSGRMKRKGVWNRNEDGHPTRAVTEKAQARSRNL
jgi:hypothetical protein